MKILAVCHEKHKTKNDLGTLLSVIEDRQYQLDLYLGEEDALPNIDPQAHDVAIIMGGSMGVYEADQYPYLYNEISYIKQRLNANLPTLGVCLGGQLMAKALGAHNYKGQNGKETGWCDVNMTPEGQRTALKYLDASQTKMLQGHQDTFDLPEGVVLLATSDQYKNQAFSYGDKALAVQFHPEMNEELIEKWINEKDDFLTTPTMPKEQIAKDTKIYVETLKKQTALFFNAWLDDVGLTREMQNA